MAGDVTVRQGRIHRPGEHHIKASQVRKAEERGKIAKSDAVSLGAQARGLAAKALAEVEKHPVGTAAAAVGTGVAVAVATHPDSAVRALKSVVGTIEEHPAGSLVAAGAAAAAAEVIAHPDAAKRLAEGILKVIGDNPGKSSIAVGLATYVLSRSDASTSDLTKPGGIAAAETKIENWSHQNPKKAALIATAITFLGLKAAKAVTAKAVATKAAAPLTPDVASTRDQVINDIWSRVNRYPGAIPGNKGRTFLGRIPDQRGWTVDETDTAQMTANAYASDFRSWQHLKEEAKQLPETDRELSSQVSVIAKTYQNAEGPNYATSGDGTRGAWDMLLPDDFAVQIEKLRGALAHAQARQE